MPVSRTGLTKRQVTDIYTAATQKIMGADRRNMPMGEKAMRLAVFARKRRPGSSWQKIKDEWNSENPDEDYTDRRRFERDCTDALMRLLAPTRADDEFTYNAPSKPATVVEINQRSTQDVSPGRG